MRYCIGSIRDNQRTRSCLIWIDCVWKTMKRWSRDRLAIWRNMIWHDVTWRGKMWHDVTLRDMTWRDMTCHDVTWGTSRGMTWHDVTWHDVTWRDMTWHDVTRRDLMRHNATWRDATQHDVTWRAISISTQQEWTLLHVRWLRYCQKTIKTYLGLSK